MKKQILTFLSVAGLTVACVAPTFADDLAMLEGKWSAPRINDQGTRCTHHLEIKRNKFVFKIVDADDQTTLRAEGEVKLDKAGPFKTVVFSNIKAGSSSSDLEPIDDTYTAIYRFRDDGAWLLVSNFDKDRDNQKPSLDVYKKAAQAQR
jgi:hypothetical protein